MIKMTYNKFMGQSFTMSIQKVTSIPLPTKAAYSVKKLADKMNEARTRIQAEYQEMVKPFAKLTDDGQIQRPKDNPMAFEIIEGQEDAYKAAEKAFGEQEVSIDRPKLFVGEFGDHKFSAAELSVLEPIIDFGDEPRDNVLNLAQP